jgi:putative holliday junction resolvase
MTTNSERLLALDVGQKRIGLAVNDELGFAAHPLMTLERKSLKHDLEQLKQIIQEQQISKLIVGVPTSLSGKISEQAQKILNFIEVLKKTFSIPIDTWDEALTTKQAEEVLIEADISRKKRKKVIDKIAASFILKSYMDSKK